jgi:predicted secreted hydrolase
MDDFGVAEGGLDRWQSPATGRDYVMARSVFVGDLVIRLRATVNGQELDTRATTGVIYWEGSQTVEVLRIDEEAGAEVPTGVGGEAYVEITRYGR